MALNALICVIKAPIEGRVKTRLAKRIGDKRALELYEGFVEHLLSLSLPLFTERFIAYDTPNIILPLPAYLKEEKLFFQEGEALGEKMAHAFEYLFAKGYKKLLAENASPERRDAYEHKQGMLNPLLGWPQYIEM